MSLRPATLPAVLLPLLLAALAPLAWAQAPEALGITPPSVELRDPPALRGEEYRRTITIQNQFDTATLVTTEPLGPIEGWLRSEPPSGFTVPPRSNQAMNVVVQVPLDAANGDYTGFLRVVAEPKERVDGSGFALRYAVAVVVNVTVSGDEVRRAALTEARDRKSVV